MFPRQDPVGPVPGGDGAAAAAAARALARDLLGPGAADADRDGVRRSTLDALAGVGLMGLAAPVAAGGLAAPAAVVREVTETLMVDASTWFCWAQHHGPVRTLATAEPDEHAPQVEDLRRGLLPALARGRTLSAIAFAHVRRPGPPGLVAEPVPAGWRLRGTLDWVTGWDVVDVVLVTAQAGPPGAELLVHGFLDAGPQAGLTVGYRLALTAMRGTHTRPLRLDGVLLPRERVVRVEPKAGWLERDADRTADASPSAFGLARVAVAELAALAARQVAPSAGRLATALAAECRDVRARAYALADEAAAAGGRHRLAERLDTRAHALELAQRAAAALVTQQAGAAMLAGHPAGRFAGEALFLLVQAQTAVTRDASMRRWIGLGPAATSPSAE